MALLIVGGVLFVLPIPKAQATNLSFSDNFNDNSVNASVWYEQDSGSNVSEQNSRLELTGSNSWNANGFTSVERTTSTNMRAMEFELTTPSTLSGSNDFLIGFIRSPDLTTNMVSKFQLYIDASESNNIYIKTKTRTISTGYAVAANTTYTFKLSWGQSVALLSVKGGTFGGSYQDIYSNSFFGKSVNLNYAQMQAYSNSATYIVDNFYIGVTNSSILTDYSANGVHHWQLDTTAWLDSVGGDNGTTYGGVTVANRSGTSTQEAIFDGSQDAVSLVSLNNESIPTAGSVSFFMYPSVWANYVNTFTNNVASGGNNYAFRAEEGGGKIIFITGSNTGTGVHLLESSSTLSVNSEYFVVFTWNNSTASKKVYINGVLDSSANALVGLPTIFTNFSIGRGVVSPNRDFAGRVRNFSIWNTEIPTSTIWKMMFDDGMYEIPSWSYDGVGIGDSLMIGGTILTRLVTLNPGMTTANAGVSGETSSNMLSRYTTDAINVKARMIWNEFGTNDYYYDPPIPQATTETNIYSMLELAESATTSAREFILGEVPPATSRTPASGLTKEEFQEWTKELGALYREVAVNRKIKFAPAYQELAYNDVAHEDDIAAAYDSDGVHFTASGYNRIGDMYNLAAVPLRMFRWGNASFPAVNDESWDWWILGGGASISGDADTGTLVLPQNATASGPVKAIIPGSKLFTITPTVSAGSAIIQYRTSANNFNRDNGVISWSTYTVPFASADTFIQVRLVGASVADASVTESQMQWTDPFTITSISSDKTNGSYKAGEVIDMDVTFSEAVSSNGNVTVTLDTGGSCTFTVSSAAAGTCNYTVQSGENSSDLNVSSVSGVMTDADGNQMTNLTPVINLSTNKNIVIDTTPPTVNAGSDATASTTLSQNATVTGAATYQWAKQSGSGAITFGTATAEDTTISADADGTYVIRLTAIDSAGNTAYDEMTLVWDTATPNVVAIDAGVSPSDRTSLASDGWFKYSDTGSDDRISFSFTDPASISDDTFYYELNVNSGNTITGDESTTTTPFVDGVAIAEGTNYFHVRPKSGVNIWGTERIFIVKYDKTAPSGATLAWGTIASDSVQVTPSGAADGSGSGLAASPYYIEIDKNAVSFATADANSGWVSGVTTFSSLNASEAQAVRVKARDIAGNESDWATPSPVYQYTLANAVVATGGGASPAMYNPPSVPLAGGFKIIVNDGVRQTDNRVVKLKFNAGADVKRMAISNSSDFSLASQEQYQAEKMWTLAEEYGPKTVYVKFFTEYGQPSEVITYNIIYEKSAGAAVASNNQILSYIFNRNLRKGNASADVKKLQQALAIWPEIYPEGMITSYFGNLTEKAVRRFQCKYKIVCKGSPSTTGYGLVGPKTRVKLREVLKND